MEKEVRSLYFRECDLDLLQFINEQPGKFSPTVLQMVREVMSREQAVLSMPDNAGQLFDEMLFELRTLRKEVNELRNELTTSGSAGLPPGATNEKVYKYSEIDDL